MKKQTKSFFDLFFNKKFSISVLLISLVLSFAACGSDGDSGSDDGHTHTWGAWTVTTAPNFTASTAGEETRTCSGCGASETQVYPVRSIGDTGPAGGKIIYVATSGFAVTGTGSFTAHYLEAAPCKSGNIIKVVNSNK